MKQPLDSQNNFAPTLKRSLVVGLQAMDSQCPPKLHLCTCDHCIWTQNADTEVQNQWQKVIDFFMLFIFLFFILYCFSWSKTSTTQPVCPDRFRQPSQCSRSSATQRGALKIKPFSSTLPGLQFKHNWQNGQNTVDVDRTGKAGAVIFLLQFVDFPMSFLMFLHVFVRVI